MVEANVVAVARRLSASRSLLLVPDAGGRGKGVLSGKVYEYIAAGRPILAVVPPDGAAAALGLRHSSIGTLLRRAEDAFRKEVTK
jgi:hypothetical protein